MHFQGLRKIVSIFAAAMLLLSMPTGVLADEEISLLDSEVEAVETTDSTSSSTSISITQLKKYADLYEVPQEFLDELKGKKSITRNQLKKYAVEFQLSANYVQRYIKDEFVFRQGKTYQYVPVNQKLAKNKYNWNNLKYLKNNEIQYRSETLNGIKGIDVSTHQGTIDWKKVKADGVKFAIIRLGYRGYGTGKLMIDNYFHKNMKGAKAAGIKVGVYFYTQAISTKEAIAEADLVIKNLKNYDLDYPVVYDIEDAGAASARTNGLSTKKATDNVIAFCDRIQKAGYRPMIYANSVWYNTRLDMTRLTKYDKWLAQYLKIPFFPYQFQIWQYTGKGRVNGIKGDVDMNISFKNYSGS